LEKATLKTMAALQDDAARNGPWKFRIAPFRVRNIIVVAVVRNWARLTDPERKEHATQCVIVEAKNRCSYMWYLLISVTVRAFITWIIKKYKTDPAYLKVIKHVRRIQGGRFT